MMSSYTRRIADVLVIDSSSSGPWALTEDDWKSADIVMDEDGKIYKNAYAQGAAIAYERGWREGSGYTAEQLVGERVPVKPRNPYE